MRAAFAALAIGLLGAAATSAGDLTDPVWTQAPGRPDWAKVYPTHAAQASIEGSVKLRCAATAEGALSGCSILQETPSGEGFGAAALLLSSGMQLRTTAQNGQAVAGRYLVVPVKFEPGVLQGGTTITEPSWLIQPTPDQVANYWPAGAREGGRTAINCAVSDRGAMEDCRVLSESPAGQGLGDAALAMSSMFLMRPMTVDGQPVGGSRIVIPFHFEGGAPPAEGQVRVARRAPWIAAPTVAQVAAAYPSDALGKIAVARVVLECGLTKEGGLHGCEVMSELPEGKGFGAAALSLAKDFRAIVNPQVDRISGLRVQVPFDFEDPSKPTAPNEISEPMWLRRINPQVLPTLFPEAATKAGVKAGEATLDCGVIHDGTLTDCKVTEERPAGLGFGEAARVVAAVMKMTAWTDQGGPVDGARIQLPVKFTSPDAAAKP